MTDFTNLQKVLKGLNQTDLDTSGLNASQLLVFNKMDVSALDDYISKIQHIRDMLNVTNSSDETFDAVKIEGYSNALKNLTSEQQALILSTQGLSTAQIQQVLAAKKAEDGSAALTASMTKTSPISHTSVRHTGRTTNSPSMAKTSSHLFSNYSRTKNQKSSHQKREEYYGAVPESVQHCHEPAENSQIHVTFKT